MNTYFSLCILAISIATISTVAAGEFKLKPTEALGICNGPEGLDEPSGLALSPDGKSFWTVSDETPRVFNLDRKGKITSRSFAIDAEGLEGIAVDPSGNSLWLVKECSNEIIHVNPQTKKIIARKSLMQMSGYSKIEHLFTDGDDNNKGLEGITCHPGNRSLFVLKEGNPGLILEINRSLTKILHTKCLNKDLGFKDGDTKQKDLDFSGICYDADRDAFWIVSDKGQRLFLFDWDEGVLDSKGLKIKGNPSKIQKAEGVIIDPETEHIYVVCDDQAHIYEFELKAD